MAALCSVIGLVRAGETIATDAWEYEAPAGWTMNRDTFPPQSIGPHNELMQFSSSSLPALSEGAVAASIRAERESVTRNLIQQTASAPDLRITKSLQETNLAPELKVLEIDAESKDRKDVFDEFVLIGPHAIILVTYEAPSPSTSLEIIRRALFHIKWAA